MNCKIVLLSLRLFLTLFSICIIWMCRCESSSQCQTTCPGLVHLLMHRSVTNPASVCGFIAFLHVFHAFHVLPLLTERTVDDVCRLFPEASINPASHLVSMTSVKSPLWDRSTCRTSQSTVFIHPPPPSTLGLQRRAFLVRILERRC